MSLWEPAPAPVVSASPVPAELLSHPQQQREAIEPAGQGEPGLCSAVLHEGIQQGKLTLVACTTSWGLVPSSI